MSDPERNWYVFYVMPQHEKKTAECLSRRNIEYYLPLITKKRRWSDRFKMIDFPLFPGYIFARIDWQGEYASVFQCPGIKGCIRDGGRPSVMPDAEIGNLKILESRSRDLQVNSENYMPGEAVRIAGGPMRGLVGTVERAKSRTRVYIRLSLLNTVVSAEFGVEDIEKEL